MCVHERERGSEHNREIRMGVLIVLVNFKEVIRTLRMAVFGMFVLVG